MKKFKPSERKTFQVYSENFDKWPGIFVNHYKIFSGNLKEALRFAEQVNFLSLFDHHILIKKIIDKGNTTMLDAGTDLLFLNLFLLALSVLIFWKNFSVH